MSATFDWTYPMQFTYAQPQDYYYRQLAWNYLLIGFTYRQAYEERSRQVKRLRAEITMLQQKLKERKSDVKV